MTRRRAPSPTPMLQHGLLLAAVVITLLPYAWMVSSSLKANADIVSDAIELIPRHPISTAVVIGQCITDLDWNRFVEENPHAAISCSMRC